MYGLTPFGSVPADSTSKSSPPACWSRAWAIWLRALLPVHRKRTRMGGASDMVASWTARTCRAASMVSRRSRISPSRVSRSARCRAMAASCWVRTSPRPSSTSPASSPWAARPGVVGPQAEATERHDQAQQLDVGRPVRAVAVGLSAGGRQDPLGLVPADRPRRHAGSGGQLGDVHRDDRTASSDSNVKCPACRSAPPVGSGWPYGISASGDTVSDEIPRVGGPLDGLPRMRTDGHGADRHRRLPLLLGRPVQGPPRRGVPRRTIPQYGCEHHPERAFPPVVAAAPAALVPQTHRAA